MIQTRRFIHLTIALSRSVVPCHLFRAKTLIAVRSITPAIRQASWTSTKTILLGTSLAALILYEIPSKQHLVYLDATETPSTAIEPETKKAFPLSIPTSTSEPALLMGLGARKISFLKINVYVVGLYMRKSDVKKIGWKTFNSKKFMEDDALAEHMLSQPVEISLRIEPVRTTNGNHLRDGFTRSLLQRMNNQSSNLPEEDQQKILLAIQEFKTHFPKTTIKPGSAFIFTKLVNGSLMMEYEGELLGIIKNPWLSMNFFMAYLNAKTPISKSAKQRMANEIERIVTEA